MSLENKKTKGNYQIVSDLIQDLRLFEGDMAAQIGRMASLTNEMGDYWKDSQYKKFRDYMESVLKALDEKRQLIAHATSLLQGDLNRW